VAVGLIDECRRGAGNARQATGPGDDRQRCGPADLAQGLTAIQMRRAASRIDHRFAPTATRRLALLGLEDYPSLDGDTLHRMESVERRACLTTSPSCARSSVLSEPEACPLPRGRWSWGSASSASFSHRWSAEPRYASLPAAPAASR